ncbi:uncharacterized protein CXQ87_000041 [Candidozyma duobushaemuli]|uniref:Uncharacterized protein n=2 Tax=Candidozyma TaxID=3303203 RepID=A0ABX8I0I3_9ASCO|nr:uncharacterized protein CXQ87_000041 [[Candida] duobushaemulonis]PVH17161.1 hypothetical protein CXQ87_000041 [[Candida] duobushaemulonis]QWU85824.1 hypothetical protein CA3LBN_000042 [[Candida] haemuloni]
MDPPPKQMGSSPIRLTRTAGVLFPLIFLITCPFSTVLKKYSSTVSQNAVLSFLNYIFVQQLGYLFFTIAFLSYVVFYIDNKPMRAGNIGVLLFKYAVITIIGMLFHGGFFKFSLVELVNKFSGGHCSDHSITMAKCRQSPEYEWVDGVDISSHYYFLSSSVLMLLNNQLCAARATDTVSQTAPPPKTIRFSQLAVLYLSFILMSIWVFEFIITSLFFHTPTERLFGLIGVPAALLTISLSRKLLPGEDDGDT